MLNKPLATILSFALGSLNPLFAHPFTNSFICSFFHLPTHPDWGLAWFGHLADGVAWWDGCYELSR
jgi:hypothetical protein